MLQYYADNAIYPSLLYNKKNKITRKLIISDNFILNNCLFLYIIFIFQRIL